jgi:gliding motility-associated-like protein
LNNQLDEISSSNPIATCPGWRSGFETESLVWVTNWFSPSDTGFPPITWNNGWSCHQCQLPWQVNHGNAKPGYYPFPQPVTGVAYAQINIKSTFLERGFIAQKLQDTLEAGTRYCLEYYQRPFKWTSLLSKGIGVLFSADSLDYYTYLQNVTPLLEPAQVVSDTNVWTHVKGSFIALGNEHYINFGNFHSDVGSNFIPSNFPTHPWWDYNNGSYLLDAPLLCKCSDTLYTATLPNDTLLCPNEQLVLQPLLDGFKLEDTTTTYLWSTGSTDSTITVTQPGTYWVHTTINQRFVAGDTIVVDFFPANYQFNLPDTVTFCEGDQAVIQSAVLPPNYAALTAYLWNTGSTLTGIAVRNPGLYWLNAQTPCYTLTDSTWVLQDFCESYLWVPNAFTPDGDGLNDFFEFQGAPAPVTLHIFDRWGKRVFYSDNYNPETSGWDGTYQGEPLPGGVYTYLIEYNYINPNATQPDAKGSPQQARGTVTIIR